MRRGTPREAGEKIRQRRSDPNAGKLDVSHPEGHSQMETPVEGMHPHSMQTQAGGFRGGAEETVWPATPQSGTLRSFMPHPQVQGIGVGQSYEEFTSLRKRGKDQIVKSKKKYLPNWEQSRKVKYTDPQGRQGSLENCQY